MESENLLQSETMESENLLQSEEPTLLSKNAEVDKRQKIYFIMVLSEFFFIGNVILANDGFLRALEILFGEIPLAIDIGIQLYIFLNKI